MTATKTGGERNETRFPEYFVEAFGAEAADANRDGTVSVAEAFEYARAKTVKAYEQAGLLLTEHAALEDDSSGRLASMLSLRSAAGAGGAPRKPASPTRRSRRSSRSGRRSSGRSRTSSCRREAMPAAQYEAELERLLTALALKTRAIQERQVKK